MCIHSAMKRADDTTRNIYRAELNVLCATVLQPKFLFLHFLGTNLLPSLLERRQKALLTNHLRKCTNEQIHGKDMHENHPLQKELDVSN